jgi:uncharacterized protein (TIGR02265 family)
VTEGASTPSGTAVRGHIVAARFRYIERHHGSSMITSVMESLQDEDRALLTSVARHNWYPFQTVLRLDKTIARVLNAEQPAIFERFGEASAQDWAEWVGQAAAVMSVHTFLARTADNQREIHTFGFATYNRLGFNKGELRCFGYPEKDPVWCRSALGFLRRAVQILTRGEVTVQETQCQCSGDEACVYQVSWEGKSHDGAS